MSASPPRTAAWYGMGSSKTKVALRGIVDGPRRGESTLRFADIVTNVGDRAYRQESVVTIATTCEIGRRKPLEEAVGSGRKSRRQVLLP
jgi:hypothetical protein